MAIKYELLCWFVQWYVVICIISELQISMVSISFILLTYLLSEWRICKCVRKHISLSVCVLCVREVVFEYVWYCLTLRVSMCDCVRACARYFFVGVFVFLCMCAWLVSLCAFLPVQMCVCVLLLVLMCVRLSLTECACLYYCLWLCLNLCVRVFMCVCLC